MAGLVTAGLKTCYENIDKKLSAKLQHPKDYNQQWSTLCSTNMDGQFDPPSGMYLLASRYRYIDMVARGHTAVVIKAEDTFNEDKLVIIKVLHENYFLIGGQEADILQEINSADPREIIPIIRLRNVFRLENHYCLVFDLYSHEPLIYHFSQKGWVKQKSLRYIKVIAAQLLIALNFLHSKSIIHADLKPENILLFRDEYFSLDVRIVDFGNSIRCTSEEITLYEDDYEMQTVMYRAPEVMFGIGIGCGIDLWSVGCILAELYLAKPLFDGETKLEVLTNVVAILGPFPTEFHDGKFGSDYEQFLGSEITYEEIICRLQRHFECMDFDFLQFIAGFLKYRPEERVSALDALSSAFLAHHYPLKQVMESNGMASYSSLTLQEEDHQKFINYFSFVNTCGIRKPCLQVVDNRTKLISTPTLQQGSKKLKMMENTPVDELL